MLVQMTKFDVDYKSFHIKFNSTILNIFAAPIIEIVKLALLPNIFNKKIPDAVNSKLKEISLKPLVFNKTLGKS